MKEVKKEGDERIEKAELSTVSREKRYSLLKRAAAFCLLNGKMEEYNERKGEEKPLSK